VRADVARATTHQNVHVSFEPGKDGLLLF